MFIKNINNIKYNGAFKSNIYKTIKNFSKENVSINCLYTKDVIKKVSENYDIDDYSLLFYDFDVKNKDTSLTVKNKAIFGHTKDKDIDLKIKRHLYKDIDVYTGFIDDKPVHFECETYKNGWNDYTLEYKNVENIDKEILDIISIQKSKRLNNLLFATSIVRI